MYLIFRHYTNNKYHIYPLDNKSDILSANDQRQVTLSQPKTVKVKNGGLIHAPCQLKKIREITKKSNEKWHFLMLIIY